MLENKLPEKDINDVFDDILFSEDNLIDEGYKDGFELGKSQENVEGFHLGYHRGAELGAEIGFYTSVVEILINRVQNSDRIFKELDDLKQILAEFPNNNDPEIDILELITKIRGKYRKICAVLKIPTGYHGTNQLSF